MNKRNYQRELDRLIENLSKEGGAPSLLLGLLYNMYVNTGNAVNHSLMDTGKGRIKILS